MARKGLKTLAMELACEFADEIETEFHVNPRVRNFTEACEHGYTQKALATICYEGLGDEMMMRSDSKKWQSLASHVGLYFEPYSTWLIAIYAI